MFSKTNCQAVRALQVVSVPRFEYFLQVALCATASRDCDLIGGSVEADLLGRGANLVGIKAQNFSTDPLVD